MVLIETPFETPDGPKRRARPRQTPRGAPLPPPQIIDRVLHRADSTKKISPISKRTPRLKAFQALRFLHGAKYYDQMVSKLIAEISRG
jgi:hypothetical protein